MKCKIDFPSDSINLQNRKINYSIGSIQTVRRQLIGDLYKKSSNSHCDINLKRKIGVLTYELIDYYLNDKKPIEFNVNDDYFEKWSKKLRPFKNTDSSNSVTNFSTEYEIDIDDLVQTPNQAQDEIISNEKEIINTDVLPEKSLGPICNQNLSEQVLSCSNSISQKLIDPIIEESEIRMLNKELNMEHGCSKKCLKYIPVLKNENLISNECLMYFCDHCLFKTRINETMMKHLRENDHFSASEYYVDIIDNNNTSFDVKYLKKRSSLTFVSKNFENNGVFCPKCYLYFDQNIISCALHYKYSHRLNELIYSTSKLIQLIKLNVGKNHSCIYPNCNMKFKKLTDLTGHMDLKHIPSTQINIFHCPFDDCKFKSNSFFTFKTHLMTHSYFNRQSYESDELRVTVLVFIYSVPKTYFHLNQFDDSSLCEKKEELNGLDYLLNITKGLQAFNEINNKLKARKDQIVMSLPKSMDF